MRLRLGNTQCTLSGGRYCTIPNAYLLEGLQTDCKSQRSGGAKKLLRAIKKWALRKKVCIALYVGQFGPGPDNGQLIRFYSKMGFITARFNTVSFPQWMVFNYTERNFLS